MKDSKAVWETALCTLYVVLGVCLLAVLGHDSSPTRQSYGHFRISLQAALLDHAVTAASTITPSWPPMWSQWNATWETKRTNYWLKKHVKIFLSIWVKYTRGNLCFIIIDNVSKQKFDTLMQVVLLAVLWFDICNRASSRTPSPHKHGCGSPLSSSFAV